MRLLVSIAEKGSEVDNNPIGSEEVSGKGEWQNYPRIDCGKGKINLSNSALFQR